MYREKEKGVTRLTGQGITEILQAVYPVGAYFFSHVNTPPNTLFGFGTWSQVAKGRMLIGVDETGDTDWDTAGDTGGAKTHTLTSAESPGHTHSKGTLDTTQTGSAHTHGPGSYTIAQRAAVGSAAGAAKGNTTSAGDAQVQGNSDTSGSGHTHTISGETGGVIGTNGQAHNNMPPFLAAYIWRRTA